MLDFRVTKVRSIAKTLGFDEVFYDDEERVLAFSNGFYFKFTDTDIAINAICMEVSADKEKLIRVFCKLINESYSLVSFSVNQGYVWAVSAISDTVFMREDSDSELKNCIKDIFDSILSATKHLQELIRR